MTQPYPDGEPSTIVAVPAKISIQQHHVPGFAVLAVVDTDGYMYAFGFNPDEVDNPLANPDDVPEAMFNINKLFMKD